MAWVEVFAVFLVSHMVGDYLLQTDWQARNKRGGLSGGEPLRALTSHVTTYTLSFAPALVWIADDLGAGIAWVAAAIFVPHFIQDDGRLLATWDRRIKGFEPDAEPSVAGQVDQSFHWLALMLVALAVGAAT